MTKAPRIMHTTRYDLFHRSSENRQLKLEKHKRLSDSMKEYGFLSCFPIVCELHGKSTRLIVKDGQHRLAIAEELGLPVFYVVTDQNFDVAMINSTPVTWKVRDFAEKFAADGKEDYQEALNFSEDYGMPLTSVLYLLAGKTSWKGVKQAFSSGQFKITDRPFAESVATLYNHFGTINKESKTQRMTEAIMWCCCVPSFSVERMKRNASKRPEVVVPYTRLVSTLEMLEDIYNFGHHNLVPLKILAQQCRKDKR